ncbi:MAG: hypothetical protein HY238_03855 [Acidobacteria bacterium]|nr:hypothetical protein [Acidobacteriota bacterium]
MPPQHGESALWVCWSKPVAAPAGAPVLSFLSPAREEEFEREHGDVIRAREASLEIRARARDLYLSLVARIGAFRWEGGLTLRQAMQRPGEASQWWYHPVASKDCESDPTFNSIIAVLTVCAVARQQGARKLMLVGATWEMAAVLKSAFQVEEKHSRPRRRAWRVWLRGLGSRIRLAAILLRQWTLLRGRPVPRRCFDVVISGFWDWSVSWNPQTQSLADRYFGRLPEELRGNGRHAVGWFAWLDPHSRPGQEHRKWKSILGPLDGREDVVLLQSIRIPGPARNIGSGRAS